MFVCPRIALPKGNSYQTLPHMLHAETGSIVHAGQARNHVTSKSSACQGSVSMHYMTVSCDLIPIVIQQGQCSLFHREVCEASIVHSCLGCCWVFQQLCLDLLNTLKFDFGWEQSEICQACSFKHQQPLHTQSHGPLGCSCTW